MLRRGLDNLEKKVDKKLRSNNIQDLRYKKLCLHPRVELPLGYKVPKLNVFDRHGDPVMHLKDYCSRLIGSGNNEALLMRLFIQSLLGITLTWYVVKQDFDKWHIWEDMYHDFVEQHKFNTKADATMLDLLGVSKLNHESFEEYVKWWRLEASKIHPPIPEEELIQTFIRSLDGIYYKTLFFTCIQSFESLIRIEKELEYGIQTGKIIDVSAMQTIFQTSKDSQDAKGKIVSTPIPQTQYHQDEEVHASFDSYSTRSGLYNSQESLTGSLGACHKYSDNLYCHGAKVMKEPVFVKGYISII